VFGVTFDIVSTVHQWRTSRRKAGRSFGAPSRAGFDVLRGRAGTFEADRHCGGGNAALRLRPELFTETDDVSDHDPCRTILTWEEVAT
jgi:hypothetical protein